MNTNPVQNQTNHSLNPTAADLKPIPVGTAWRFFSLAPIGGEGRGEGVGRACRDRLVSRRLPCRSGLFVAMFFALLAGIALFAGNIFAAEPARPKAPENLEELQQRINEIVSQPRYYAAFWGVKIASLDSGKLLYATNAEKLFSPASNSKLYTMGLALDRLGPDYRIKTSLYAQSHPDADGTLKGDLILFGRGDPSMNGDPAKVFQPLVTALKNAGVKQVTGDVIGDDSYFHSAPFGSGWDWEDLENYYGAEISSLTFNSNLVQVVVKPGEAVGAPARLSLSPPLPYIAVSNLTVTVAKGGTHDINLTRPVAENIVYVSGTVPLEGSGSIEDATMHDPAAWIAALFKEVLAKNGITVSGNARSVHWRERENSPLNFKELVELGSLQSLPLRDIIRSVEKPSNNLYTDLILEHIGAGMLDGKSDTAEEAGIRELNRFLQKVGIRRGQTIFEEGSGLSRDNLTSPTATVALLTYMSRHKSADVYFNALPIAGVDGSLRRRMKGTPAANNVHAKTGSLRWAHTLSGYVTSAAGEHLVFSLMLNRFAGGDKTGDLDAIAELLASFPARTTGEVASTVKNLSR